MPSQTFLVSDNPSDFVVPTGVTSITVDLAGGEGAAGQGTGANGGTAGKGGRVEGTLAVTPGETLRIYAGQRGGAGGAGGSTGGAAGNEFGNGGMGGTGGGSSDIRRGTGHADRVCVAGGGGGGGGSGQNFGANGGAGGNANTGNGSPGTGGGSGGTAGGAPGADGANGGLASANGGGGGGGGGGYQGGSGGGGGTSVNSGGGGGGAGTALTTGLTNVTTTDNFRTGNGYVTLTWQSPPDAPTLDSPADGATIYDNQNNIFQFDATDPDAGDTVSGIALKVTIDGVTKWWQDVDWNGVGSWMATETFVSPTATLNFPVSNYQIQVNAGQFGDTFDNNGSGKWSVAVKDAAGATSPYSTERILTILPSQSQTLSPTGIASAEAFGSGTVKGLNNLLPGGIASAEAHGTPTLAPGAVTLLPAGVASIEAFGNPDLTKRFVKPKSIDLERFVATAPAFTRSSVAYLPNGRVVPANHPRFVDGVDGIIAEATTNLLTDNQAGVETDLTGLTNRGGGTIERVTTEKWQGLASAKRTMPSGTIQADWGVANPTNLSITPSVPYTLSAWVKAPAGTLIHATICERDSGGTLFAQSSTERTASGEWERISHSRTVASNAASMTWVIGSRTPSNIIYVDNIQLEQKAYPTQFTFGTRAVEERHGAILIEEGSTNLVAANASQNFEDAWWTKTRASITADALAAPDGTQTADKLVESLDNGTHYLRRTNVFTAAQDASVSVYAKAGERTRIAIGPKADILQSGAIFDLLNGTVVSTAGTATATIEAIGNGWYRCAVTDLTVRDDTMNFFDIALVDGTATSYQGLGTQGAYIWRPQAEVKTWTTSWQIGGTARGNEFVSYNPLPSGMMSRLEGTVALWVFITPQAEGRTSNPYLWSAGSAGSLTTPFPNRMFLYRTGTGSAPFRTYGFLTTNSAAASTNRTVANVMQGRHMFVCRWSVTESALFLDGSKVAFGSNPILPDVELDRFYVGSWLNGGINPGAYFEDIAVYNRWLTDQEIIDMYLASVD